MVTTDRDGRTVDEFDVVQIDPDGEPIAYRGCFVVVEELLGHAVQGYVRIPEVGGPKPARCRVESKFFRVLGQSPYGEVPL
jgi:hypothetical protein